MGQMGVNGHYEALLNVHVILEHFFRSDVLNKFHSYIQRRLFNIYFDQIIHYPKGGAICSGIFLIRAINIFT